MKISRKSISKVIHWMAIFMGAVVFIFPFIWLISSSLKSETQIFVIPPQLVPKPVQWKNYILMFKYFPFSQFLINSVYITVMTLIGTLVSCPLVAYSFARLRWPGRDILFIVLLSSMMLPYQITMVPRYLIFIELHWIDTFKPLWVPSWLGVPFYVFLLRQFFITIPREIEDAAKIDGCSFLTIYARIMIPLVKPALTAVTIFAFISTWSEFMRPLVYINSVEKMPLSLGLSLFRSQYSGEWAMMMAASVIMVIPVVVMFIAFQKYFIRGIVLTGLKM